MVHYDSCITLHMRAQGDPDQLLVESEKKNKYQAGDTD
jgi:hypothetical protein